MFNEEGAAAPLAREIAAVFADHPHEIIFVDDASSDATCARLQALRAELPQLRLLRHGRNVGQSRAVRTGVFAATAGMVMTLDGDGQNDPAEGPRLLRRLRAGPDCLAMVSGRRVNRQDSAAKRFGSRFANNVRKWLLNDGADDSGCGLKVFRRAAFLQLPYFDHMHRYLPALMLREGFDVAYEPVNHRARITGASKYTNAGRLFAALYDIQGVLWLKLRARNPGGVKEF